MGFSLVINPWHAKHNDALRLDDALKDFLRRRLDEGKIVMVRDSVGQLLDVPRETWRAGWQELPTTGGILYLVQE